MKDAVVVIHPIGWLVLVIIALSIFFCGYTWGYFRGWLFMKRKWEANTFEFEQQKEKA